MSRAPECSCASLRLDSPPVGCALSLRKQRLDRSVCFSWRKQTASPKTTLQPCNRGSLAASTKKITLPQFGYRNSPPFDFIRSSCHQVYQSHSSTFHLRKKTTGYKSKRSGFRPRSNQQAKQLVFGSTSHFRNVSFSTYENATSESRSAIPCLRIHFLSSITSRAPNLVVSPTYAQTQAPSL